MLAEESLREGRVDEALAQLQEAVRNNPSEAKYRVFLFQLLAVTGQWDRALNQLNVSGELDPGTLAMVQMYGEALQCEGLRAQIFAGQRSPVVFGEPEEWIALVLEALKHTAQGRHAQGQELRARAFEEAPTTSGSLTLGVVPAPGEKETESEPRVFSWIADADSRFGPILEAIVLGKYYWVPFHRIRELHIERPEDLRDLVWAPAHFTWANGGEAVGLIPSRYPGSEASEDGLIRLARRTDWDEHEGDTYLGLGQRVLATDEGEHALLGIRTLRFDTAIEEETGAEPEGES